MEPYLVAGPELRDMFSKAAHFRLVKSDDPWAKAAPVVVERQIRGHAVRMVGRQVERTTLDGLVLVTELRASVDGRRVNRTELFRLCGEVISK